ncbi:hypothetical protein ACIPLR_19575 [Herbaspirillum huttiense]|jgi:hypothetical protein|uniref:Uncharacterized protein n=2 Tax=Herbaspirillum huttiense TaxID=863372 RepID=A0AAJ2HH02_9BURK|nr:MULTISPECIES: hypothetical protein [Herbaspirillum]MAF01861.1 hypothetical protein [Herbaspirillum sp.]MBN9358223.1 hypothetical protein [Herbaspirillum huttiense]MBO17917.1 hypothetical protein [Herbaspirillum sp.]MCP3657143.1 hypothetical protein [Herbaspirillum sp.]MCP3947809.1 hypothetical protein [Herbaspirillum sp.]|tara:strand:+ start:608 stop:799 length:192 start_codon:yes stop_codon:yes gene_type:complete
MFGITGRIWSALATVIKLEDKVIRQSEALRQQQIRIENLTERMIKLETLLEVVLHASEFKRIK